MNDNKYTEMIAKYRTAAKNVEVSDADINKATGGVGGANDYLEDLLGCHVDMIRNHNRLTPFFRKQVERDGITIF